MTGQQKPTSRRGFLTEGAKLGAGSLLACSPAVSQDVRADDAGPAIPRRVLGRTGVEVSILGVGGGGHGRNPQIRGTPERPDVRRLAVEILNRALDAGINYVDSCTGYGQSESVIGEVAASRRKEMFLATKCDRCAVGGDQLHRELEQSLRLLRTERIDLWQIHNIRSPTDVEAIFRKDHAIEVFQKAREEGVARFIGITVHSSRTVIRQTLDRCRTLGIEMDTLLVAFNAADGAAGGHGRQVLREYPALGKIAMKVLGGDGVPIERKKGVAVGEALRYALSHDFATAIVGMHTLEQLEANVETVRRFEPYDPRELAAVEGRIGSPATGMFALRG